MTTTGEVGFDELAAIARAHAHGIEMYANEIRMIPLEPTACSHEHRAPQGPGTS